METNQPRKKAIRYQQKEIDLPIDLRILLPTPWATIALILTCTTTFLLMVLDGQIPLAQWWLPTSHKWPQLLRHWGALEKESATKYENLIRAIFLHAGAIHLLVNMYALYRLGEFVETMFGKLHFLLGFLTSGIVASLSSLLALPEGRIAVGASGAICGLLGMSISFCLFYKNALPTEARHAILKQLLMTTLFLLLLGLWLPNIDNAAHIGGAIAGWMLGILLQPKGIHSERKLAQSLFAFLLGLCLLLAGGAWILSKLEQKYPTLSYPYRKNTPNKQNPLPSYQISTTFLPYRNFWIKLAYPSDFQIKEKKQKDRLEIRIEKKYLAYAKIQILQNPSNDPFRLDANSLVDQILEEAEKSLAKKKFFRFQRMPSQMKLLPAKNQRIPSIRFGYSYQNNQGDWVESRYETFCWKDVAFLFSYSTLANNQKIKRILEKMRKSIVVKNLDPTRLFSP
ncbi:MAG: rhomboid family intramembrane serine protease [Planctomycetota bacterium]|nr:MAG: rhomboid family intramembrane serine protease [Planctomycetota bacterium]